jgi:hypothetical protein
MSKYGEPWRWVADQERIVSERDDGEEFAICGGMESDCDFPGERIVECVNALAGVENPEAELKRLLTIEEYINRIISESRGVDGFHLNGDTAMWAEFPELQELLAEGDALRSAKEKS